MTAAAQPKAKIKRMIRGLPQTGYAAIGRELLQDKNLSGEARIIAAYVLSQVETWEVRVMQLADHFGYGRGKVYSLLKSLMLAGYGARRRCKGEDGLFDGVEYVICDDRAQVEKLKVTWREGGTPPLDDIKVDEEPGEEDEVAPGDQVKEHPCADFRHADKRDAENRHEVEISNIKKQPHSPFSAAAAPEAQPPQGEKPPDPALVRPSLTDFEKAFDAMEKKPWLNFREREKARKRYAKLSDTEAIKAYACVPNHIKQFNALYARWASNQNHRERGEAPKLERLAAYFGFKIWQSLGVPSEPLIVQPPKPPSEAEKLCKRISDPAKSGDRDGVWRYWHAQGSSEWEAWDAFFRASGFAGAPSREASSTDLFCGAIEGETGWRFPIVLPDGGDMLTDLGAKPDDEFKHLISGYENEAMWPFAREYEAWQMWLTMTADMRAHALQQWKIYIADYKEKFSKWARSLGQFEKPALLRPDDYLWQCINETPLNSQHAL